MHILITGASGQLGRALQSALSTHDLVAVSRARLDITDHEAVPEVIAASRPDALIHAAALTDTDRCESDPALAIEVNAAGAGAVAEAAERAGARLILISTNEVFDGATATPYAESAAPRPINAYGRAKLEGERWTLDHHRAPAIVRTSWLYGDGPSNFVAKVLDAARSGRALRFVTDETASPTSARDLAEAIAKLIELPDATGIYHLANEGEASRYEWAREILRFAGMSDAAIEPITTADLRAYGYEGPAKPPYSVLENTRARALGITMRPWREALAAHFQRAQVAADG